MHTYCRLKNGKIMVLYSDNVEKETMHLYSLDQLENFDAGSLITKEFNYSEIDRIDTNLVYLTKMGGKGRRK